MRQNRIGQRALDKLLAELQQNPATGVQLSELVLSDEEGGLNETPERSNITLRRPPTYDCVTPVRMWVV